MQSHSILLVDDHPVIAIAWQAMVQGLDWVDHLEIATTVSEAVGKLKENAPTILVVDLDLPDLSGMDLIRQARRIGGDLRILVHTCKRYEVFALMLRDYQVNGFVSKGEHPDKIISTLELVSNGYSVLPAIPKTAGTLFSNLSDRERSVASMLVKGLSNKEIGERLCISERTVSVHKLSVLRKTGLGNSIELALAAREYGYQ